ncbi:hypothetical protein [Paenibacillus sp. GYB004]|jgi:hypothetical protein|uniref:hypothetical protein n=1 Tax=unclassified Paenibacillus TaxID=185978 RepID=UPI002F9666E2
MIVIKWIPYVFIAIGLINIIFPATGRFWNIGWQTKAAKAAKPGETAVLMSRIGGLLALGLGLFLLLYL